LPGLSICLNFYRASYAIKLQEQEQQTNNCTMVKERQSPLPRLWGEAESSTMTMTTTTTRYEEAPNRQRETEKRNEKRRNEH